MAKFLQRYEQVSYELNLFRERRIAELKRQPCDMPERSRKKRGPGSKPGMMGRLPQDMH